MEREPFSKGEEPPVEDYAVIYQNELSIIEKDLSEKPDRVTEAIGRMMYIYEPLQGLGSRTEEIVVRQNKLKERLSSEFGINQIPIELGETRFHHHYHEMQSYIPTDNPALDNVIAEVLTPGLTRTKTIQVRRGREIEERKVEEVLSRAFVRVYRFERK